jgi:tetratricopeptide (TPR) repeat protein
MSRYSVIIPALASITTTTIAIAPSWGLSAPEVAKIAKGATVNIDDSQSGGSGVTIQKQGDIYTVLTAAHVVRKKANKLKLQTSDNNTYAIDTSNIKILPGVDLAVVTFKSKRQYAVARLGNPAKLSEGSTAYVGGFPTGTETITERIFNFTDGKVTANSSKPLKDGYAIIYSNNTLPGMSGGGVFNDNGELVAIHGKGDVDTKIQVSDLDPNVRVKTGFNLGIPVDTFTKLASTVGVAAIAAANNQPPAGKTTVVAANNRPPRTAADEAILIGFDRVSKNDIAGAIKEFDRALTIAPKSAAAQFWRGACQLIIGNSAKAIADLTAAIKLTPKRADAYMYRSSAHAKLGNRDQAIADANMAISLAPTDINYGNRCNLQYQLQDFSGAIVDCDKAIQINPKNPTHHISRGVIQIKLNDRQTALADFNRAIALDRSAADAFYHRGVLKAASGNKPGGLQDLNRAAQLYQKQRDPKKYRQTIDRMRQLGQKL